MSDIDPMEHFVPVRPLGEYRYCFQETGVGCAEHDDPNCLCDVIITQVTPLSERAVHYEFGATSGERPLSRAWLENILAIHDARALHGRLEEGFSLKLAYLGRKAKEGFDYLQFLLDLGSWGMNAPMIHRRHGICWQTVNKWRRDLGLAQSALRRGGAASTMALREVG